LTASSMLTPAQGWRSRHHRPRHINKKSHLIYVKARNHKFCADE
jgi:hypothetical protein